MVDRFVAEQFIRMNFQTLSYGEMARQLGMSRDSVKTLTYRMGLQLPRGCISHNVMDEKVMRRWREELA